MRRRGLTGNRVIYHGQIVSSGVIHPSNVLHIDVKACILYPTDLPLTLFHIARSSSPLFVSYGILDFLLYTNTREIFMLCSSILLLMNIIRLGGSRWIFPLENTKQPKKHLSSILYSPNFQPQNTNIFRYGRMACFLRLFCEGESYVRKCCTV